MYYWKRLAGMIPLLIVIAFFSFVLVRLAPGGPFDRERVPASPEVERQLKARYHLDEPVWKQFARYLYDLAHGDLGPSLKQRNHTVNDIIGQALPVSLALGGCAFCFAIGVGVPLGFWTGMHKGQWQDWVGSFLAILFICIPALVLAPLAVMVFAIKLKWFPVALVESPRHFVLPTVTLGIYFAGRIARLMREGMAGVLDAPFMMAARAKGLSDVMACLKHALPIAVLPVLSYSGPLLADLLTGSFVVENVFQVPGLGIFIVNSALAYDYTLIVGLVLLYAALLLVLNFLVDVGYAWLDPRVRFD